MHIPFKVASCQLREIREDRSQAAEVIADYSNKAEAAGARLVCFPECYAQGYLLDPAVAWRQAMSIGSTEFHKWLQPFRNIKPMLVVGMIEQEAGSLFNTAAVIKGGVLVGRYRKQNLLSREKLFHAGSESPVFRADNFTFGIAICFDTQFPGTIAALRNQGAELIVCPANNMMGRDNAEKWKIRHNEMRGERCRETGLWLVSSDVTGTMGDCVGLGPTCVLDPDGHVIAQVPLGQEGIVTVEIPRWQTEQGQSRSQP